MGHTWAQSAMWHHSRPWPTDDRRLTGNELLPKFSKFRTQDGIYQVCTLTMTKKIEAVGRSSLQGLPDEQGSSPEKFVWSVDLATNIPNLPNVSGTYRRYKSYAVTWEGGRLVRTTHRRSFCENPRGVVDQENRSTLPQLAITHGCFLVVP
mmetsp:Transcript_55600/g.148299  ORF Transcript_55600/g.148299 Transcript_55600/m.148299 type:complete len:151 (-) Transcript_55600:1250-1702(-)